MGVTYSVGKVVRARGEAESEKIAFMDNNRTICCHVIPNPFVPFRLTSVLFD